MGNFAKFALAGALTISTATANAAGDLYLYNWTDYIDQSIMDKFEKDTGIKVTLDTYDSNETLLAKLKSGATGYDLAVPSQNFVPIMISEGLIQKVDVTAMSNYKFVDERWKKPVWDTSQQYSSPYQMGTTSYAIRTDAGVGTCASMKEFFEPNEKASGQISVFKSPEEIGNMAHLYLGQDFCTEKTDDYKAIQKLLENQKPHVKIYSSEGMGDRLAGGVTTVTSWWNGDAMRTRLEGNPIQYCFPKEGVVGWFDSLVIPIGAKNAENAKAFMNWLMAPENMALLSNFARYANAIPDSAEYMDADLASAPEVNVPNGVPVVFGKTCGPKYIKAMDKIWTKLLQ